MGHLHVWRHLHRELLLMLQRGESLNESTSPPRTTLLVRQPRQARLQVRQHDLQRRGPTLVPVKRKRDFPPVNLIAVDGVRQLKRRIHPSRHVTLVGERAKLVQAV